MNTRAISRITAVVVIIVILVVAAGASYFLLTSSPSTKTTTQSSQSTTSQSIQTTTQSSQSTTSQSIQTTTQSSQSTSSGVFGGTVKIGVDTATNNLDPPVALRIPFSATIMSEIFEKLVYVNGKGDYVPGLAVNWTVVNPTTIVFHLRQGVTFSDGSQFNATAVQFSFEREIQCLACTQTPAPYLDNVTVLNDYTVQFNLRPTGPYGDFLNFMATQDSGFIVSPLSIEQNNGMNFTQPCTQCGLHPVGTGPYMMTSWVQNDHVTLQANPNYWGPRPHIQTVVVQVIPDATARLLALQSGQVQLAEVPPQYASQLNSSSIHVQVGPIASVIDMDINLDNRTGVMGNLSNPAFAKVQVRQALNFATNRTALVDAIWYGYATPAEQPLNPDYHAPFYNSSIMPYPFGGNITMAKMLLAQAGYPNGINVTIDTSGTFVNSLAIATILQQQWAQANIHVTIKDQAFSVFVSDLFSCRCYQLDIHDSTHLSPYQELYTDYSPINAHNDLANINDSKLTSVISQLGITNIQDTTSYSALTNEALSIAIPQSYMIFLFYSREIQGWSTSLVGYQIAPWAAYKGLLVYSQPLGINAYLQ